MHGTGNLTHGAAPSERLRDDRQACCRCRYCHQTRQPQLPGDGDHGLSQENGGTLEKAAAMANHASTRTTQLYDRRPDELSLDEVDRIVI
jgi:hypothetical protein